MLKYFFENSQIEEVKKIITVINDKKNRLIRLDFEEPFIEYDMTAELFGNIKVIAIENENEKLANSQYIAKIYLHLFCNLASYFSLIKSKKYSSSWIKLQDCLDDIVEVGKFVDYENRYEINELNNLLHKYEELYPYKVFNSVEYVITKSECSICGNPMNSLRCPHIKGNLYWGEVAVEKVTELKEFNAVALVSHPLDKKCIIELSEDNRSEDEKFQLLHEFVGKEVYPFQDFAISTQKIIKQKNIAIVGRNEKCPCGSDQKFKKCCGRDLYYEHYHHKIYLKEKIMFYFF